MRLSEPVSQGVSIVALGDFNPRIFQPYWFATNNLIREEEASTAEVKVLHHDVTIFDAEWFSLQVEGGRYALSTTDPSKFRLARDLVQGTFRILEHTPIRAFGFNRDQHFALDEKSWASLSRYLAPDAPWNSVMSSPKLASMVVHGRREDSDSSHVQVKTGPSAKTQPGICVDVNEHYDFGGTKEPMDAMGIFLRVLGESWDGFVNYATGVPNHLLSECPVARD